MGEIMLMSVLHFNEHVGRLSKGRREILQALHELTCMAAYTSYKISHYRSK
jgi:hypothetical protein